MKVKYPCGVCEKNVAHNHNAVCCDICQKWVHISCNNISRYCYKKLQKDTSPWYCKTCIKTIMPYSNLTDHQLEAFMLGKIITSPSLTLIENDLLFPNEILEDFSKTEYITPEDFFSSTYKIKSKELFIHLNISSISYHID